MWCEDDANFNHACSIAWFNENFKKVNEYEDEKRNPYYIGKCLYHVVYKKNDNSTKSNKFIGICENFNTTGLCAFWNEDKEMMLLVDYKNILGLYPFE